jgi:hypothetical protein
VRERHGERIVERALLKQKADLFAELVLMRDGNIVSEGSFEDLEESRDEFVHEFLHRDCTTGNAGDLAAGESGKRNR